MSQERSLDHFVDRLEKRARAARTISIAITIGVLVIGAVTVFFTIRQIRKQINEEKGKLAEVQQQTVEAQTKLEKLKREYDVVQQQSEVRRNALSLLPADTQQDLINKGEQITIDQNANDSAAPNVYLQILDNNQRAQANAVAAKLKSNGLKVQGIEWVRIQVALKQTLVKYFKPEFADEAQKIVGVLKQSGIQANAVSLNASTGQIEIWFSLDAFPASTGTASQASENPALAKAVNDVMFEFFEALQRPEDKNEATNRLQRIVARLETDNEAAGYLKASGVSSKDTATLRAGLVKMRSAVTADKKISLLERIDRIIVEIGQASYKPKS